MCNGSNMKEYVSTSMPYYSRFPNDNHLRRNTILDSWTLSVFYITYHQTIKAKLHTLKTPPPGHQRPHQTTFLPVLLRHRNDQFRVSVSINHGFCHGSYRKQLCRELSWNHWRQLKTLSARGAHTTRSADHLVYPGVNGRVHPC